MFLRFHFRYRRDFLIIRGEKGAAMVISDRLRQLREEKKLSQGDIEKEPGCCVATFRALKMATPSLRSRRWRNGARSRSSAVPAVL